MCRIQEETILLLAIQTQRFKDQVSLIFVQMPCKTEIVFVCVCRTAWCPVRSRIPGWDAGAQRDALPPYWYRNLCHQITQEYCWVVRKIFTVQYFYFPLLYVNFSKTELVAVFVLSAVFTWTNLLVVVVELEGLEQEALDLVPLVTNVVLEEHYLIVGVVVVVDPGVIPINSRGEKQRMHLRDGFLADQLDPIYVAYNM